LRDAGKDAESKEGRSNAVPKQASLAFGVKDKEDSEEYLLMEQSRQSEEADESNPETREKKLAERVRNLRETHEKLKGARIPEQFRRMTRSRNWKIYLPMCARKSLLNSRNTLIIKRYHAIA
jgi:hypothetical protein